MLMRLLIILGVLFCGIGTIFSQNTFDYLKVKDNVVESVHKLHLVAKIDKTFKFLGEYHHQPTYGEKLFNVSVAAYEKGDKLLMIHAEAHSDNSGGLDYSKLKPDPLGGINFTSREQCGVIAEIPDAYDIPDFRFLRDKGFTPAPALFLKQFLIASTDGSAEYVISYGQRVASCGDEIITPAFKEGIEREVRRVVKIK
jgi:hypothetical protein